jgi:SAM-dependent methyltransferase
MRRYPSADRNKDPILEALRARIPASGRLLEVSSGTGQHTAWFAAAMPAWTFQPTEFDAGLLPDIAGWTVDLPNVLPPLRLDAADAAWPVDAADVIYCANMIHIAPWAAAEGLFAGAARTLTPGGRLITYGPYRFSGRFTAESNARFDESLQGRDPAWGVRDVDDLDALAARVGLARLETVALPANNHLLVWARRAAE